MSEPSAGTGAIAWIDGCWGTPDQLGVPLQDRGLQLADGLFETVLVQAGRPILLEAHLQRWHASAALLAMAPPPQAEQLEPLIREAIARAGLTAEDGGEGGNGTSPPRCGALRLNWSRGNGGGRGIDLPLAETAPGKTAAERHGHRFWLQLSPYTPTFSPLSARISRHERRNGASRLSRCKTFSYGQAIQARREAHEAGADEALLLSTGGGLCCGAVANLLVWCDGRWLTPPLSSGCLPGVMRGRALELGLAEEAELMWTTTPVDEQNGTADADSSAISRCESATDGLRQGPWLLLNSLGCRPLTTVNGQRLPQWSATEAEAFWRQLAAGDPR